LSRSPEDSLLAYLCRFAVRAPPASLEAFLGSVKSGTPGSDPSPSQPSVTGVGFASLPASLLGRATNSALTLSSCVTPSLKRRGGGTGISTCCPSSTPFGLDLGPD